MVLAAGQGRRMGGPKALLEVDGAPLVQRHVERLQEAGCQAVAVVVRPPEASRVEGLVGIGLHTGSVRVVPALTSAPAESLAVGLRALWAGPLPVLQASEHGLLVTPVDLLPPRVETLHTLLAALEGGVLAATPRYRGRGGHPVALRGAAVEGLLGVGEGPLPSLRDVLQWLGERRVRVQDRPRRLRRFSSRRR